MSEYEVAFKFRVNVESDSKSEDEIAKQAITKALARPELYINFSNAIDVEKLD